jgi:hypothetical protein
MTEPVRLETASSIFDPLPVLITESAERFEQLYDSLHDELKPRGLLERHYVTDIADKAWEIRRLRRVKANLINSAMRRGLIRLLQDLNDHPEILTSDWLRQLGELADKWFGDERGKKELLEILEQFNLDASAIEAAAVRFLDADLEKIDRLMASQESRLKQGTPFARRIAWRVRTATSRQGQSRH